MKERIYKKLCKKASAFCSSNINVEQGIHYTTCSCSYDSELEAEDCWPWLVGLFDGEVNAIADEDSECGISWVVESKCLKATPRNVFAWAKTQNHL